MTNFYVIVAGGAMRRGEGRTLALLEDSAAAAIGIRERAYLIMNNAPYDPLEIAQQAAIIHEYAEWWYNKVEQVKTIWAEAGRPDLYGLPQGELFTTE